MLNPGRKEFAVGLMLVEATRTKTFQRLTLDPMPNFDGFDLSKTKKIQRKKKKPEWRPFRMTPLPDSALQFRSAALHLRGC